MNVKRFLKQCWCPHDLRPVRTSPAEQVFNRINDEYQCDYLTLNIPPINWKDSGFIWALAAARVLSTKDVGIFTCCKCGKTIDTLPEYEEAIRERLMRPIYEHAKNTKAVELYEAQLKEATPERI